MRGWCAGDRVASLYVVRTLPTPVLHDDLHCAALRRGRIVVLDVAPLVTDVIDLAEVPDAFRALERPSTQCKVLIEFR